MKVINAYTIEELSNENKEIQISFSDTLRITLEYDEINKRVIIKSPIGNNFNLWRGNVIVDDKFF